MRTKIDFPFQDHNKVHEVNMSYDFLERQTYVLGLFSTFVVPFLVSLTLLSEDLYFYSKASEVEQDSFQALIGIQAI